MAFTVPEPSTFRSISSWMPSVVFSRRVPLPCIAWPAMERRLIKSLNFFSALNFNRFMCSVFFFFLHKETLDLAPHIFALDTIDPLIVTLTFVGSGKTYFSEFLVSLEDAFH